MAVLSPTTCLIATRFPDDFSFDLKTWPNDPANALAYGIQRLTAVCTAIRDSGPDTAEFDRAVHVLGYEGAQCEEA